MIDLDVKTDGPDRERLIEASLRSLNLVYWVLVALTLPPTIYQHIFHEFVPAAWVFVGGPLIYLPAALGYFPSNPLHRILFAVVLLSAAALGINSVNFWLAQPGLYVLLPPALALFAIYGRQIMLVFLGVMSILVGATTLNAGHDPVDVVISLTLFWAVATASCAMLTFIIHAAFVRNEDLKRANRELVIHEQQLLEVNEALEHVFGVVLHELREPASAMYMLTGKSLNEPPDRGVLRHQAVRLLEALDDIGHSIEHNIKRDNAANKLVLDDLLSSVLNSVELVASISTYEIEVTNKVAAGSKFEFDGRGTRAVLVSLMRGLCLRGGGKLMRLSVTELISSSKGPELAFQIDSDSDHYATEDVRGLALEGFPGAGMGLGAAAAWVVAMGGTMEPVSGELGGIGFRIAIPVNRTEAWIKGTSEDSVVSYPEARQWLKGVSILLAEDDRVIARATKHMLEQRFKATVTVVNDGAEAIGLIAANRTFDLIIVDYFMPRLNGRDLVRRLRASGNEVPVIGITAASAGEELQAFREAGATVVVRKPLSSQNLLSGIGQVLSGRGSSEA